MSKLQKKVENALNEARILVLGSQVLLGFQYRAFFEHGWNALPPRDRAGELGGLFALLLTIGVLFLPAARHRLVERGNDSARFHRFTMGTVRFAHRRARRGHRALSHLRQLDGGRVAGAACAGILGRPCTSCWSGPESRVRP